MGEIAEMMLTGVMCAGCGEYLPCQLEEMDKTCEDTALPTYCSEGCAKDHGVEGPICPHDND